MTTLMRKAPEFSKDLWQTITSLNQGTYPKFVVQNAKINQTPVFVYHRVNPNEFEEQMLYLKRNNYETLNGDEFEDMLKNGQGFKERSVVITFDDGLDNLYHTAYPILRNHGFKAIAFIMPNWIGKKGIITWVQVKEMHADGVIDFQSHSLNHLAIFTSPEIIDFYHPGLAQFPFWNLPIQQEHTSPGQNTGFNLGKPIYAYASRLADAKRYYPDNNIESICVTFIRENGGEELFRRTGWKQKLNKMVAAYKGNNLLQDKFESEAEQRKSILDEVILSKQIIEKYLIGKKVRHFAYPWNQSGQLVTTLLYEAGYATAFGGLQKNYQINNELSSQYHIHRISGDFIPRLPGEGRKSFIEIIWSKIKRRIKSGSMY